MIPGSALLDATRDERSFSFMAMFAACFAIFLALALVGILTRLDWRSWLPGAERQGSLVGSVSSAVFSFMSYFP